ncbi:hypothetical protein VTL71DRAFT_3899 [Oculimacula yallundae]|uniref:Uncharacterized protein n=1 Tax=Oculimacula yallundae TaxID=86028 RepID=A0ABR4C4C3_9HELO
MAMHHARSNLRRDLSVDNKINLIVGVLAIVIAALSAWIAWSTWTVSRRRSRVLQHGADEESATPLRAIHGFQDSRIPYDISVRFGRNG